MRRPWVKVCGITRAEDARTAVEAGAHAVGFILAPDSPRAVTPERAAELGRDLPEAVARVGVVVDPDPGAVAEWIERARLTAVQVHGAADPALVSRWPRPVVRAVATAPGTTLADLEPWRDHGVLLDGHRPGRHGGTGLAADPDLAARAVEAGFRVLLAGGLGPDTVEEAVRRVRPVAVDFNSAVESAPGVKDPQRVRRAVARIPGTEPPDGKEWPW